MVEKITIIKKLARIGISIPLFLLIIIIWVYFTIKAAQPQITDTVGSSITNCSIHSTQTQCDTDDVCDWDNNNNACENACYKADKQNKDSCEGHEDCEWTGAACKEDTSWNPFNTFCQAQATSVGQADPTTQETVTTEAAQANQPCPDSTKTRYNCGSLPTGNGLSTVNINTTGFCRSGTYPDTAQTWCDDPNLPTMQGANNTRILEERAKDRCCKDHIYESNINYIGLIGYLLITLPFVYFLIEKIAAVFINYTPDEMLEDSQFEFIGDYISKHGGKYVAWGIAIYYIILPMFRFIFVSYKCEDVNQNQSANCGKPCTDSTQCATLSGSGCVLCVNNVCENPSFADASGSSSSSNIGISVCSIKSILNDLSDDEINEIYSKHVSSPSSPADRAAKITAINNALNTPELEKKATMLFYKFMPRQEIAINDTSAPFRLTLPNPSTYTTTDGTTTHNITGFNYMLNNILHLDVYQPPANHNDCSGGTEIDCNKNHNCKFVGGQCSPNNCVSAIDNTQTTTRYSLPDVSGINSTQDIGDTMALHNKVVRGGKESNVDNMYPCNDVVISQLQKVAAKSSLYNANYLINSNMSGWIDHFELNRIECADKQGQCYMDDYVCKTDLGVPIPLKFSTAPVSDVYTIGEVSDTGCQTAMYPCQQATDPCEQYSTDSVACTGNNGLDGASCVYTAEVPAGAGPAQPAKCESANGSPCTTLDYNSDTGYLLEKANGGVCTPVVWDHGILGWRAPTSSDSSTSVKHMCIPTGKSLPINSGNTTIANAEAGSWRTSLEIVGNQINASCKSVKRSPGSSVPNASITNPYYRWSAKGSPSNPLCSDSNVACSSGTKNNLASYRPTHYQEDCCIDTTTMGPVSLYATGSEASASPISGITPTLLS